MTRAWVLLLLLSGAGCGTAPRQCNARTCSGCCTTSGECVGGSSSNACGSLGSQCQDCTRSNLVCSVGSCTSLVTPIGPGSVGGGSGFGGGSASVGGGSASVGGGSASVGGGSASVGGGSASVGGGSASVGGGSASVGGGSASVGGGSAGGAPVNPCLTNNGGCDVNAQCTNLGGVAQCACFPGWTGNGFTCSDVDECASGNGGCHANATCTNTPGSRTCACRTGFTGSGTFCSDIDECLSGTAGCSVNASCTNLTGSFSCACRSGYTGNGFTCTANTPTWTMETVAFSGGGHSALALDAAGYPAVVYHSESPRGVYLRRRTTSWSAPETVDSATNAMEPSLAASSSFIVANGLTTVVGTSISMSVSTWKRSASSPSWSPENSLSGYDRPDVAAGGGREHLVAVVRSGGALGQVGYSSRTVGSSTWSTPTILGTGASGFGPKVSASGGMVVALFSRSPDGLTLARSSNNGSTWTTTTVTTLRAWSWDVVLDPSGTVFLAYYTPDNGHRIILESYSGLSRTQQTIVDTPQGTGAGSMWFSGVSIAQSPLGTTHAAWLDFTRGNVVRYVSNATSTTGDYITETVTTADDVLGQTSLVVDSSYAVHLTYPAPSSSWSNLGYAVRR
ncbi:MAG: hypothetical protein JNJ54_29535 [Myxococcaceae bacterium]|nr:hypothetical protein [Myxococcaceae bacterium]